MGQASSGFTTVAESSPAVAMPTHLLGVWPRHPAFVRLDFKAVQTTEVCCVIPYAAYVLLLTHFCCCSVAQSYLTLQPHGLQHARLPCPSLSPGVCSNSCPLSQCYHPTISFSVTPFSSHPQSFPASGSFPMSWLFTSGGQSVEASASASVLPMNIQG